MDSGWDLPEINRVGWVARRIVTDSFSRLQPADCEDLVAEAVSIALALNTYRPDVSRLNYRHILKCIRTAGMRLGFFVPRNHHNPTFIRFSDPDACLSYEMADIEEGSCGGNLVDLDLWKKSRLATGG